jgi:AcrR family transcriptional regulator
MGLYRYVRTKDELIDLMVDHIIGEETDDGPGGPGGWRTALESRQQRTRQTALAHPWVVGFLLGRPALGPNAMHAGEQAMASLDGLGLTIDQMLDLDATARAFTVGYVQAELAESEAQRRTGLTEAEWRESVSPQVQAILDSGDFPYLRRIIIEAEDFPDSGDVFTRRLGLVLDGLAASIPAEER